MIDEVKRKPLTVSKLIDALKKLKPNAVVLIDIRQYNKAYGVVQIPIPDTNPNGDNSGYQSCVEGTYKGATIVINLPYGAFISKLPK